MKFTIMNPPDLHPKDIIGWDFSEKTNVLVLHVRKVVADKLFKIASDKPQSDNHADYYFKTSATRRAFVKAYFLFEFLINELGLSEFYQEDFAESLKYGNEKVSTNTIPAIRKRLLVERILYTDTTEHFKSSKKNPSTKTFQYIFHPLITVQHATEPEEEFRFKIPKKSKIRNLISNSKNIFSERETEYILDEDETYNLLSEGFFFLADNRLSFWDNNLSDNELQAVLQNKSKNPLDLTIYVPPYELLSLEGLTKSDLLKYGSLSKLRSFICNKKEKAKVTRSTRLYHAFHTLPRVYRKHLMYEGSPLEEVMDVHNCFYALMYKAMELSDGIAPCELREYGDLVRSGKFYEEVSHYVMLNGSANCEHDETNINYLEEEYLWFRGLNKRDLVKRWLQSYRNFLTAGQASHNHHNIDIFYDREFPTIRRWLFTYPTVKDSEGKTVKLLQRDMCRIESYIISQVALELVALGVTPFTLHDGIYLSQKHIVMMQEKLGLDSQDAVTNYVNDIFWKEYDSLEQNQVRQLLDGDYNIVEMVA